MAVYDPKVKPHLWKKLCDRYVGQKIWMMDREGKRDYQCVVVAADVKSGELCLEMERV